MLRAWSRPRVVDAWSGDAVRARDASALLLAAALTDTFEPAQLGHLVAQPMDRADVHARLAGERLRRWKTRAALHVHVRRHRQEEMLVRRPKALIVHKGAAPGEQRRAHGCNRRIAVA